MVHFFTLILNLENADFIDPESNKRERVKTCTETFAEWC